MFFSLGICTLQRKRCETFEKELGEQFNGIEDAVIIALYSTERTNSMIENLNGRVIVKKVDMCFESSLVLSKSHTFFVQYPSGAP
ncbi:MAG: hypothetical protein ACJAUP_000282 [Cellvibrionaceae bacterium]